MLSDLTRFVPTWRDLFPVLRWFPRWFPLGAKTIQADFIASVTGVLVLVPQAMAYAQLAGLPPHYGLYTGLLPGAVAVLWGSSSKLSTGPVAIVSLSSPAFGARDVRHRDSLALASFAIWFLHPAFSGLY